MFQKLDEKIKYSGTHFFSTPDPAFQEAIKAKNSARKWIVKSSSGLENNQRTPEEFTALWKATEDIRSLSTEGVQTVPEEMHKSIENVKKYSLGNCLEYAHMTIYELWKNKFQGSAEVYRIEKGDHVFVVLNRDPKSNPHDFNTWGDGAIVVDAWNDKVYKASQIPKKLKAYRMTYEAIPGDEDKDLKKSFCYVYKLGKKHILEPRHHEETLKSYRKWCRTQNITRKNVEPPLKSSGITEIHVLANP